MDDRESGDAGARDGEFDFAVYTASQLRALREHFDTARFPRNYQRLLEELQRRDEAEARAGFPVRYTASDGLVGWVQAVFARQRLYGGGAIDIQADQVLLRGWQRTWLGFPQQVEIDLPTTRIRNAYQDGDLVEFEAKAKWLPGRRYTLFTIGPEAAAAIVALLPATRSKWFDRQASDIRSFYRLLRSPGHSAWLTPLIVMAAFALYIALVIQSGVIGAFDGDWLTQFGGNLAVRTVGGEWWRLLSALFVHVSLAHLLVNMWVLWSAGRFTERLFGNWLYLAIYLGAGVGGGLASMAWNPSVVTVGASGAIFGVLGAMLSFLVHGHTRVPLPVVRAHLIPTTVFVLFSIFNGLFQPNVDNAAHVGGLFTGLMLGWAFAPIGRGADMRLWAWLQSAAATMLVFGLMSALCWGSLRESTRPGPNDAFTLAHRWYLDGETENLRQWQMLANQAGSGVISKAELATAFADKIAPFWRVADHRLRAEVKKVPPEQVAFARTVSEFAHIRRLWADALVVSFTSGAASDGQKAFDLMLKTDRVQARLDRLAWRYAFDRGTYSLANSAPVRTLSNLIWFGRSPCVGSPFRDRNPVAPSDSETDAPQQTKALGCVAQSLFLTGNFPELERRFNSAASRLGDLADGSSSYFALMGGIDDLFSFGSLSVEQHLSRTAAWRRAIPGSLHAELVEAALWEDWAYAARGYGYANTISEQNQMLFRHRADMADAALNALWTQGPGNPYWYTMMLNIGISRSVDKRDLRRIFERGRARFPKEWAIHRAMMRALMPRWFGSYQEEVRFISDQVRREADPYQAHVIVARLHWHYWTLEGDDVDVLRETGIGWDTLNLGLALLAKQHPKSDYLVNVTAKFACLANDKVEYRLFHDRLPKRYSASVWSDRFSVQSCNKKFGLK